MVTLYRNPTLDEKPGSEEAGQAGYQGYVEPDTRVPPKARAILDAVSVNGVAILEADILAEAQHHPADRPGAALQAAARALVVRELCLQEARRAGIDAVPETDAGGRRETVEDAAIRTLIEREVVVPSASQAECLRYYRNNAGKFHSMTIHQVRHILLAAPESNSAARNRAREEAERLIARLQHSPEDFAELAKRHSACPSREQDGSLGQVMPGSTVAEFEAAVQEMEEGSLCPQPVATRFGYHVVALDRRIPGRPLPFEAVRDRIAAWLEAASWSRAVSHYIAILAARADIGGIEIRQADGPLIQ